MSQSALNDEQVLELGAAIQQLRSAETDVHRKADELASVTRNRDAIKARVDRLRGQPPAPAANTAPAAAPTPVAPAAAAR